jgi:5S rRNA maturation endonuclease (ribonuclease M5)
MNWNENRRKLLAKLIDEMVRSEEGSCFIVEGTKDEKALRSIGVKSPIVKVSGPKSLFDRLQHVRCKRVIVLVDFDKAGERIVKQIVELTRGRLDVDLSLRRKLCSLLKKDLKDIEGLEALIRQLKVEYPSEFGSALTPGIIES